MFNTIYNLTNTNTHSIIISLAEASQLAAASVSLVAHTSSASRASLILYPSSSLNNNNSGISFHTQPH